MKNADMPAMPQAVQFGREYHKDFDGNGLTKREYFAGLAMQGIVSCGESVNYAVTHNARHHNGTPGAIVDYALACADALLAELEK